MKTQLINYQNTVRGSVATAMQKTLEKTAAFGRRLIIDRTTAGYDAEGNEFRPYKKSTIRQRLRYDAPVDHVYLVFRRNKMLSTTFSTPVERTLFGMEIRTTFFDKFEKMLGHVQQLKYGRVFWDYGQDEPQIVDYAQDVFHKEIGQ